MSLNQKDIEELREEFVDMTISDEVLKDVCNTISEMNRDVSRQEVARLLLVEWFKNFDFIDDNYYNADNDLISDYLEYLTETHFQYSKKYSKEKETLYTYTTFVSALSAYEPEEVFQLGLNTRDRDLNLDNAILTFNLEDGVKVVADLDVTDVLEDADDKFLDQEVNGQGSVHRQFTSDDIDAVIKGVSIINK